jgi:hypothetical protein
MGRNGWAKGRSGWTRVRFFFLTLQKSQKNAQCNNASMQHRLPPVVPPPNGVVAAMQRHLHLAPPTMQCCLHPAMSPYNIVSTQRRRQQCSVTNNATTPRAAAHLHDDATNNAVPPPPSGAITQRYRQ